MDAMELLLNRQSNNQLCSPAPNADDLSFILAAGMKVPDHGNLSPWHFTVFRAQGLAKLSQIFVDAVALDTTDEAKIEKTKKMPFRAPLVIAISSRITLHEKVPNQEQVIAAGCAVHAMQMAAFTLGYGAIWRTGALSYNESVKRSLQVSSTDEIVGFLYIGTKSKELPSKQEKPFEDYVTFIDTL